MKEKHYFASANTGRGFINYFNYINDDRKKGYMYILKGGPGTGKSTLMKKIGKTFLEKGVNIEYFHCSSDVTSLDGVRLKDFNISIVDGTSPHVTEASIPEIKERIINLGEYIGNGVSKYADVIEKLLTEKKKCYKIAYEYIEAIYRLYSINAYISENPIVKDDYVDLNKLGHERKLFYGAITSKGNKSLINIKDYGSVEYLESNLNLLRDNLIAKGYDLEVYYNNIYPERVDGIYVVERDKLILTNNRSESSLSRKNLEIASKLMKLAGKYLDEAKKNHKEVEKYYIQNMDFSGLNRITEKIIGDINRRIN